MGVEEVLSETRARLAPLLAPINDGVGDDPSYDESFESIKTEIDKVNSIEGGSTDWSAVAHFAEQILTERSKDFRIALYYFASSVQKRQLDGLVDGLVVMNDLCAAFWEPMYPALKRPRARGNLCSWLSEQIGPVVQTITPVAADKDRVALAETTFRALDGLLADKLGDAYPGMMGLRDQVNLLARRVPEPPAEAPPPPPPAPPPPPSRAAPTSERSEAQASGDQQHSTEAAASALESGSGGGGLSAADIVDGDSAFRALAEIAPLVGRAGDVFLSMNPASADGFRLGRVASWLLVGGTPDNNSGATQVDGPGEHVPTALAEIAATQDWNNLLVTAGQIAASYPLLLDGARYLALALNSLGPDYEAAARAVERETAALLARAPELPSLTFSNGVPFASEDTKAWASGLAAGGGGGGAQSPVDKAVADAAKLVAEDRAPEAVTLLSRAANQLTGPAHRFRARLEIAKLCLQIQQLDMALAQLETLEKLADRHRLASWDPELCADMYAHLYRARRLQAAHGSDDPDLGKKVSHSFQRLCELDAAQALKVTQEG